jgi:glucoamylase
MPLAWAHSEYVRLLRSIRDNKVFDCPNDAWQRYVQRRTGSDLALWRFDHQVASFPSGRKLRIETSAPAIVHFSTDNWSSAEEFLTRKNALGIYVVDLPTSKMSAGQVLHFTFRWPEADSRWEGRNFDLVVDPPRPTAPAPSKKRKTRAKAMVYA